MLVPDTETQGHPDATRAPALGAPSAAWALEIPARAEPYRRRLREALARFGAGASSEDLQNAFAAASGVVASVTSVSNGGRPDLEDMRRLDAAVPEFSAFLSCAAGEADRIVAAGTADLWRTLGLRSVPPAWTLQEREAARMLFACACAPAQETNPARLRGGLRGLAAGRFARLLAAELGAGEEVWATALRDRYASVRHRCAPRTTWRSRGLSDLVRGDEIARRAIAARLEQWLAGGGEPAALGAELEAALVHARTPARFA